jgi:hypothetical protein
LEEKGFNVWWGVLDLKGGDSWLQTIQAALEASEYCVVVLPPAAIRSEWVEKEYLYAINLRLKVISVLYKPCKVPMVPANIHYIDFRKNGYDQGLQGHLKALVRAITPSSNRNFLKKFKEFLLKAARDAVWQMIGALISIIALIWAIYSGN